MAGLGTLILVTLRHVAGRILSRQSRKNYGAVNIVPARNSKAIGAKPITDTIKQAHGSPASTVVKSPYKPHQDRLWKRSRSGRFFVVNHTM